MGEHQVLFCPFCRESFEGLATCPEHELRLVPFIRLPPDVLAEPRRLPRHDELLSPWDLRFGRGFVLLAALLNGGALLLPLFLVPHSGAPAFATHQVANVLPSLWTLALVSFTLVFILLRRRTRARLASVRLLVPLLAFLSPAALLIAFWKLREGRLLWFTHADIHTLRPGLALYAVLLASALMAVSGLRLGVAPTERGATGRGA